MELLDCLSHIFNTATVHFDMRILSFTKYLVERQKMERYGNCSEEMA